MAGSGRADGAGHDRLGSRHNPKRARLAAFGPWRDLCDRVGSSFKKINKHHLKLKVPRELLKLQLEA